MVSGGRRLGLRRRGPGPGARRRGTSTRCTSTTACATAPARDERVARDLCVAAAGRPARRAPRRSLPPGNLQAAARDVPVRRRRALCAGAAAATAIVTGHTPHRHRRDRCSTASPPRPARGRCSGSRRATAGSCGRCSGSSASGCASWSRSPGCRSPTTRPTLDPAFARNRIRAEVLPVLRELNPAAERNVAETRAELAEEAALLERVVLEALDGRRCRRRRGGDPGRGARRLGARRCAAWPCARSPSAPRAGTVRAGPRARRRRSSAWPLSRRAATVDLGGGVRAICESGLIRFATRPRPTRHRPRLPSGCPGGCRVRAAGRCAPSFTPGR